MKQLFGKKPNLEHFKSRFSLIVHTLTKKGYMKFVSVCVLVFMLLFLQMKIWIFLIIIKQNTYLAIYHTEDIKTGVHKPKTRTVFSEVSESFRSFSRTKKAVNLCQSDLRDRELFFETLTCY